MRNSSVFFHSIILAKEIIALPQLAKHSLFSDAFGEPNISSFEEYHNSSHTGDQPFRPSTQDVWISNSFFHDCHGWKRGGAFSSTSISVNRVFIEETTFTACTTSSEGGSGAIYYINAENGQCVLYRICGFNCTSSYGGRYAIYGIFARINVKSSTSSLLKNEVNESTISGCRKLYDIVMATLELTYGKIICSAFNITSNACRSESAFTCRPGYIYKQDITTCFIKYTSTVNNTSRATGCISFSGGSSTFLLYMSNIINNKQCPDNYSTTIYTNGKLFIKHSCIIGNNEGCKVFRSAYEFQIKITNCTLDDDFITNSRYSGSLTIVLTNEYRFINSLSHFNTENCDPFFVSDRSTTAASNTPEKPARRALFRKMESLFR